MWLKLLAWAFTGELADKVRRYAPLEQKELRTNPKKASTTGFVIETEGAKVLQAILPQVSDCPIHGVSCNVFVAVATQSSLHEVLMGHMSRHSCAA